MSMEKEGRPYRPLRVIVLIVVLGATTLMSDPLEADKAYLWRDREGKIHVTKDRPDPQEIGGGVEEREFKVSTGEGDKRDHSPRTPIEHAVLCSFRLANNKGGGSGFFINDKGLAITAKHVVQDVSFSMRAELPGDEKKYGVQIVARGKKYDLALLKVVMDRPTPYLQVRDPKSLIPGEELWAVGNPLLAFKETVTKGNFSRLFLEKDFKKELKMKPPYKGDWIQFSAPVTGGNSGGPVVDKDGKLVGIVSLGFRDYGAVNLAVPSAYVMEEFGDYLR